VLSHRARRADQQLPAQLNGSAVGARIRSRAALVVAAETTSGAVLGLRVRRWALLAVAALVTVIVPFPAALFYYALIAGFIALGEGLLRRVRRERARGWEAFAFVAADFVLLTFTLVYPNPLGSVDYPATLTFKFGNAVYLFLMLGLLVFAFRPALVIWGGGVGAAAWGVAVLWLAHLPGNRVAWVEGEMDLDHALAQLADPTLIDLGARLQEIGVFLIVAGILAVAVQRSHRLIIRQAMVERERANLARYFAPAMVDRLATRDTPLAEPRAAEVAVLFVDIVGFTSWAQDRPPEAVIARLRDVHGRLERAIFAHGGTLDKFIGDGVMATFGTPDPGPDDAARAVACVAAILADFAPEHELPLAVGLHMGAVMLGDIGSERRMEFAVLGDTVNVASRLERLARDLHARAVLSDVVVQRAGGPSARMRRHAGVPVRGRHGTLDLWTL